MSRYLQRWPSIPGGDRTWFAVPGQRCTFLVAVRSKMLPWLSSRNAPFLSPFPVPIPSSRFYFVHAHSAGILLVLFPPPGSLDCRDLICIPLLRHERSSLANGERFVVRRAQRRKRVEGRIGEEREREKKEKTSGQEFAVCPVLFRWFEETELSG